MRSEAWRLDDAFLHNLSIWFLNVNLLSMKTLSNVNLSVDVIFMASTARKVSKYGVFSGPLFFHICTEYDFPVFSPTVGKYGPEETPYLDTFHAIINI